MMTDKEKEHEAEQESVSDGERGSGEGTRKERTECSKERASDKGQSLERECTDHTRID